MQGIIEHQQDPGLIIDQNLRNFCSQITETVGKNGELMYVDN